MKKIASKGKLQFELDRFLTSYSAIIAGINKKYPVIGDHLRYEHLTAAHQSAMKALFKIIITHKDSLIVVDEPKTAIMVIDQ